MVVVENDGQVLWIPPAIYMSSCAIDITNFPFDEQTCNMKFGSWTYDGLKLDIHFYAEKAEIDTSDYIDSNEWNLIGHPARRRVQYYVGLETPHPVLYGDLVDCTHSSITWDSTVSGA